MPSPQLSLPLGDELDDELEVPSLDELDELDDEDPLASVDDPSSAVHAHNHEITSVTRLRFDQSTRLEYPPARDGSIVSAERLRA